MSDPSMTPPPVAPQPTDDKATFNTRAFSFFSWFSTFITEMLAVIAWISERASFAGSSAQSASQSAGQASASAGQANTSKVAAAQSEANALAYAQTTGTSAGIPPPVAKKWFGADENANPGWYDVPQDATKLPKDGGVATRLGAPFKDLGDAAAGANVTFDAAVATVFRVKALGNLTLSFANVPLNVSFSMELLCVNFGGRTMSWPPGKWVKTDGSQVPAVGNSGVTWQTAGEDRVLAMFDGGSITYKVMR